MIETRDRPRHQDGCQMDGISQHRAAIGPLIRRQHLSVGSCSRKHFMPVQYTTYLIILNLLTLPIFFTLWSNTDIILSVNAQRKTSDHEPSISYSGNDETDLNEFAEFEVDPDSIPLDVDRADNQKQVNNLKDSSGSDKSMPKDTAHTATIANRKAYSKEEALIMDSSANHEQNNPHQYSDERTDDKQKAEQSMKNAQDSQLNEYDDDEFEYKADETKPKEDLKVVNAPLPMIYTWDTYYVEIMFMAVIMLYIVNFFIGSGKNEQFACIWYEANRSLLKQNFALVGGPPQFPLPVGDDKDKDDSGDSQKNKQPQQRGLIKDTESSYVLWCSGRVGMEGLLVEINLLKRQDLLSMFMNLLKPSRDNFILRMQLNHDSLDNFVFCLAQKQTSARLAKEMIDINTFCPERKPVSRYGVNSEKLYLMNEIKEVATFLFDPRTSQLISKYEDCIDYIHITDQYSLVKQQEDMQAAQKLSSVRRMATFSFNFPKHSQNSLKDESSSSNGASEDGNHNTKTMVLLALTIIDRLRRFRLGREGKQKSEKNRQKITDILQKVAFAQRQEAAQAKKDELRRQEKERIYEEDDPEKQRKWERKEAKRELKKSRKVKQLKVKSKG